MVLHLVTAEDPLTLEARSRELIRFPQLTMPLLAALTPEPWFVTHTDEITHEVNPCQPCDVVGITAATPGAPHAYDLAAQFHERSVKVVMGGPHATLLPYEVVQHADCVVVGEAEPLWAKVLSDIEHEWRYAPGRHLIDPITGVSVESLPTGALIYRCSTPASLAGLSFARRDLIRDGGWNKWWATRGAIIATRGCPHQCDYCAIPVLYPKARQMRYRPVEEVAAEIAAIPDKGIVFWDDNLGANPAYAKSLFRAIAPLKKWWTSQTTMTSVVNDDEFLRLAAESGCKALFLGLESVNQTSLTGVHKDHNRVSGYKILLERFHAYGIAVQAGIIFGFDSDTKDIFSQTVDVMSEVGLDNATISLLVPFPGTPAHARLSQERRIIDSDWRHYNGKTHVVYRPKQMTPDELMAGYEWAKTQFYAPGCIWKRLSKSRTGLWWNIPRNLGYLRGLTGEVKARAAMHGSVSAPPLEEEVASEYWREESKVS
ncbi:MAG TPA: radical SAM protein [Anaerolineales bacterium]|nr:radical SAM protein [Anaerolineales bacterium]